MHLLFWGLLLVLLAYICADDLLLCSTEFCQSYLEKQKCRDLSNACSVQNATYNGVFLPSPVPCNCCEYCLENLAEGAQCAIGDSSSSTPTSICGSGLSCQEKDEVLTCQKAYHTKCLLEQQKYDQDRKDGTLGHLRVRPKCNRNGLYEPYRCIPGETCFCVSEDGERLFGEISFSSLSQQQMRCGCSRGYHKAFVTQNKVLHTVEYLRCQSNGDYDTLQCIEDKCFCVDAADGHLSQPEINSVNITELSAEDLPCFNNKTHMEAEYYRECEILYRKQLDDVKGYEKEGLEVFGYKFPNCQLDGNYAGVQESSTTKYCVDESGKMIEDYEVLKSDPLSLQMNCKCARARNIIPGPEKPECCKNGNYQRMQCRRSQCRCVNEDGEQIEKEVDWHERHKLTCAQNLCE